MGWGAVQGAPSVTVCSESTLRPDRSKSVWLHRDKLSLTGTSSEACQLWNSFSSTHKPWSSKKKYKSNNSFLFRNNSTILSYCCKPITAKCWRWSSILYRKMYYVTTEMAVVWHIHRPSAPEDNLSTLSQLNGETYHISRCFTGLNTQSRFTKVSTDFVLLTKWIRVCQIWPVILWTQTSYPGLVIWNNYLRALPRWLPSGRLA